MTRTRLSCIVLLLVVIVAPGLGLRPAAGQPDVIHIGLITDAGRVDDRSFNQSAFEGALLAADALGGTVDALETADPADFDTNLRQFADREYDIIITTGAAIGDAVLAVAAERPDIHFIAVDVNVEALLAAQDKTPADAPNVHGLIFREDQAGFLAGVLAARLTRTGLVGAVLPTNSLAPVVNFAEGFSAGATYINPAVRVLTVYHPGGLAVAFDDPEWGAKTAGELIDQGADVIFAGGGKTGNGGLQAVAQRTEPREPVYCIGVDTDQWYSVPEAQPCLITSALKRIREGVDALVQAIVAGQAQPGNVVGVVGLAPFHDFDMIVPGEVILELRAVEADLQNGRLLTDGTRP
ncbi:MAG: BMP family ABC transporter substrate-binding protein [Anaerolineae bacterium]|nr:BMP family ABC transporter substrate-binding protein [Anaerolineae bacterium]